MYIKTKNNDKHNRVKISLNYWSPDASVIEIVH